jgi:hypothetical protein
MLSKSLAMSEVNLWKFSLLSRVLRLEKNTGSFLYSSITKSKAD